MRTLYAAAFAVLASLMLAHAADAGSISTPAVPSAQSYLTVADVTMVVSSKAGYAHLRQGPSTSSTILEKLPKGTQVVVIGKAAGGKWAHVKVNGKEGYIAIKLLK